MNRITLLNSLPFLYKVESNDIAPTIWKQHGSFISRHLVAKDQDDNTNTNPNTNTPENLFSCHALSIEPIAHHCGETAGVAFFSEQRTSQASWESNDDNNNNSITSTEQEAESSTGDPALAIFTAYILSARHSRDGIKTPRDHQRRNLSPALSSASTAMTNPNSPRTPRASGTFTSTTTAPDEIHVLYFVIDHELYCVDHCQIRSMEVDENTSKMTGGNNMVRPSSLLLTFDSCVFRVFYDSVISGSEPKSESEQETLLQNGFRKLKAFMLAEGTKYAAELRSLSSGDSFLGYLDHLIALRPDDCAESSIESENENGQTSNPSTINITNRSTDDFDNNLTTAGVGNRQNHDGRGQNEQPRTNPISSRLDAHDNSWKSLQAIQCLLKMHKKGKVANNLDQGDTLFTSLANKSARECTRSYMNSEFETYQLECLGDEGLSQIQESMEEVVHQIFPAKKNYSQSSTPSKTKDDDFSRQIEEELRRYKTAVTAKHRSLGFTPKR